MYVLYKSWRALTSFALQISRCYIALLIKLAAFRARYIYLRVHLELIKRAIQFSYIICILSGTYSKHAFKYGNSNFYIRNNYQNEQNEQTET